MPTQIAEEVEPRDELEVTAGTIQEPLTAVTEPDCGSFRSVDTA